MSKVISYDCVMLEATISVGITTFIS